MGIFSRKGANQAKEAALPPQQFELPEPLPQDLPNDEWLGRSEARYKRLVESCWGSCETVAEGGKRSYETQDFGTALFFFQKSIDMLHSEYLFGKMQRRQPSAADVWIIEGYTS